MLKIWKNFRQRKVIMGFCYFCKTRLEEGKIRAIPVPVCRCGNHCSVYELVECPKCGEYDINIDTNNQENRDSLPDYCDYVQRKNKEAHENGKRILWVKYPKEDRLCFDPHQILNLVHDKTQLIIGNL